jgi:hypothetical protein
VAAELDINAHAQNLEAATGGDPVGNRTVEALEAENRRLRREMGSLIRQQEILKKLWASSRIPATTL